MMNKRKHSITINPKIAQEEAESVALNGQRAPSSRARKRTRLTLIRSDETIHPPLGPLQLTPRPIHLLINLIQQPCRASSSAGRARRRQEEDQPILIDNFSTHYTCLLPQEVDSARDGGEGAILLFY